MYTIVKGHRNKQQIGNEGEYEKNERKFGDFTIRFKIPEEYERKWFLYEVDHGVLTLKYKKDVEECVSSRQSQEEQQS